MGERDERVRERVGGIILDAVREALDDASLSADYEGHTDRILADPEIARWRQIAQQEPVAWGIEVTVRHHVPVPYDAFDDVYLDEAGAHMMLDKYVEGSNPRVVPLVPLTTEPPE